MNTRSRPGTDLVEPMLPVPYRVAERTVETHDSVTLRLDPLGRTLSRARPGQFMMLYARGVGEVAISLSGISDGSLGHTVRAVGAVSRALHDSPRGTVLGVRGPFGTGWEAGAAAGHDLVIVAGGVGLAPLRPVVLAALADRTDYRRVIVVAGARTPDEFLFRAELDSWTAREDMETTLTIDRRAPGWSGPVGFVTEPLSRLKLDPPRTKAFLCGPEPMMRFCAEVLAGKGIAPASIRVSLERNMKCGAGLCGHCQLGPLLLCRDGPVVDYAVAGPLLRVWEL
ncbi:FAD/NAD(P)-binding protein [Amycolatopsis orientalis]|uniref:FAD/NAD(P)-binding protein n=1 Tax=Amycolatopsis orientalis TaxID=31958 RepID=UPI000402AA62|nr:FAD/NAD(P)-binding protein [Amycolatopsis orientalis]